MAKYSTGSSGTSNSDTCELCGEETSNLETVTIEGATLQVCPNCASKHGSGDVDRNRDTHQVQETPDEIAEEEREPGYTISRTDSEHWEKHGTNYQNDATPYLVKGYPSTVTDARQSSNMSQSELADSVGVPVEIIEAIEEGVAAQEGVGKSTLESVEEILDVTIIDEKR